MQINIVKVEEKHSKDGTKAFYVLHDNTGAEITTYESGFKAGDVVEGEIKLKGKYVNLQPGWKLIESKPAPAPSPIPVPQPRESFKEDTQRQTSIENQVRAKIIADLWTTGTLDGNDILVKKLKLWLGSIVAMSDKTMEAFKSQAPSDAPQSKSSPIKQESSIVVPEGDKPPRFKDGNALVKAANKKMSLEKIYRDLKIEKPSDIVDIEAAAKVLGI